MHEAGNYPLPDDTGVVFKNGLEELKLELRAQGVLKQIREFDGEGSRKFKEWSREVERAGSVISASDERLKTIALQTLKGSAADFCARIMRLQPHISWVELKRVLFTQYSDTGDSHIAKTKLRNLKQRKGESIQNFVERIFSLGDEAFAGEDLNNPLIQSTLIDTLVEGVINDSVSRKIIREKPETLDRALSLALREQQDSKAFELRRRHEEPMDVSYVSESNKKFDLLADAVLQLEINSIKFLLYRIQGKISKVLKVSHNLEQIFQVLHKQIFNIQEQNQKHQN